MTDPYAGLDDRTRIMPPPAGAMVIDCLDVKCITIGGIKIQAQQGTRYANGRLSIEGRDDNSAEVQLVPGPDCQHRGIMSQLLFFTRKFGSGFKRYTQTIFYDGIGDIVMVNSDSTENLDSMPVYDPIVGGKTHPDGSDTTGKYTFSYFQDGSHEFHLQDDTLRVEIASFVQAFIANDRSLMHAREKQADGTWKPLQFHN